MFSKNPQNHLSLPNHEVLNPQKYPTVWYIDSEIKSTLTITSENDDFGKERIGRCT